MTTATSPEPRFRPGTSRLPGPVTLLLDEAAATQILCGAGLVITGARPEYLRHKPGETTIISYRFDTPDQSTSARGHVHWCVEPSRADEIHRKALTLRPRMSAVGVSIVRVDAHTVFYGFPNDARLRRLRWYTTPRKLKPAFASLAPPGEQISKLDSTSTVLKYKPERRLVARVDLATTDGNRRSLLVRYTTTRSAPRLAAVASALLGHGVPTPTPRAQLDDGHVAVDDFVAGVELRSWLIEHPSVAPQLAASLRAFHSTPPPAATPVRRENDELANALDGLAALSVWDHELGRVASEVARLLTSHRPARSWADVLIHGDLHDKNVLVDDGQISFIDLERTAVGAPASDLGRLRAHAIALDIRRPGWSPSAITHAEDVIEAYRSLSSRSLSSRSLSSPSSRPSTDERTLGWHCAIALVDQALLVVRHVEPGWESTAQTLLAAAITALRSAPQPGAHRSAESSGAVG